MADDSLAVLRAAIADLAAADPRHRRFGARRHHYRADPPLADDAVAALEARCGAVLPGDLRAFVRGIGGGGVGPYYGLGPIADAPVVRARWGTGLAIIDLGCGYAGVIAIDGPATGQIWLDARAVVADPVRLAPSFTAIYAGWIERTARGEWPAAVVAPGLCPLAGALGGYFGACERRLGLAAGTLAGSDLAAALAELGPGAIAIAADRSALVADGERVDPCVTCAQLLDGLGLPPEIIAAIWHAAVTVMS